MRRRDGIGRRTGSTLTEAAIVLSVFLTTVLAMVDVSMALFRTHVLTEAARHGARQAIVHGSLAVPAGPWGPQTIGPVAVQNAGPVGQAIQTHLGVMDPAEVTVLVEWLDGGNEPGMRVRVTLTATYQPIMALVLGDAIPLCATSTMRIAH